MTVHEKHGGKPPAQGMANIADMVHQWNADIVARNALEAAQEAAKKAEEATRMATDSREAAMAQGAGQEKVSC